MKTGFGLGLGLFASQVVFVALGLAFFIPGLLLVRQGQGKEDKSSGSYIGGMILLVLGVILMGGFGLGAIMDNL
jgi:hypothetical protein